MMLMPPSFLLPFPDPMEMLITTLMPFLLPLLLLLVGGAFLFRHSSTNRMQSGGILPPGSRGWPFIRETLRMLSALRSDNPETYTDERISRYGRLFTSQLLFEPTVLSADPEFNRLLFNGDGRSFENSLLPTIVKLLGPHALINMTGPLHKRLRSLTLARFSTSSVMKDFLLPETDRHVRRTLNSWQDGERVVLTEQTQKMGFGLLIKKLINEDPGEWTDALRREFLHFVGGFVAIPLPSFLAFSFMKYGNALRARAKVHEELLGVVKRRKAERKAAKAADLLDELIMMEDGLDEEGMVEFLVSLLVGGYDLTSAAMTVAVKFLTENPHALACLRKEHEQIRRLKRKADEPLEWSDYQCMTFTQWVINETLRIANIVPGIHRRATTAIHYKGYTIPKGCKVAAWTRAVHLDSEVFENARSYNPWRWENAKSENVSLLNPFGSGHRLCPGYKLARLEVAVFLHYLVTVFDWDVTEEDKLVYFPTVRTLKGYPIIVRRKPLDDTCCASNSLI